MRMPARTALACAAMTHVAGLREAAAHAPGAPAVAASGLSWNAEPWLLAGLGLVALAYAVGARRLRRRVRAGAGRQTHGAAAFAAGWLVLALALVSPLDAWAARLFAAHMVQHELLMLAAAPLLVLAAPGAAFAWALPAAARRALAAGLPGLRGLWRAATQPLPAWALHGLALWIWHLPVLFQAALESGFVHALQHLSFFLAAVVFWRSLANGAAGLGVAVLSLFTTAAHASLLGALLTFAPGVLYPAYLGHGAPWGLTALEDQQLGGLIMWMPGGVVYLLAALWLLARWLVRSEQRGRRAVRG